MKAAIFLFGLLASAQADEYIKAPVITAGDEFGAAVAIDSDTLVIGSPLEADSTGAAYIYTKVNGQWVFQARLDASDKETGFRFGDSVAISGSTVVVGSPAHGDSSGSFFVDPSGAAYVFVRENGTWTQQKTLLGDNTGDSDNFGISVDIDDDRVVVGARFEAGVGESLMDSGAAYVFGRTGIAWSQEAYLKAPVPKAFDEFGTSVSISGSMVAIGAPLEDGAALNAGAVFLFEKGTSGWLHKVSLRGNDAASNDFFGTSVCLDAERMLIGARGADDLEIGSGAAYIFRNTGAWLQEVRLKAASPSANAEFGTSVSLSGRRAAIGAPREDATGTGAGAVWRFSRSPNSWTTGTRVVASNAGAGDGFGSGVAVSFPDLAVGAPKEDAIGETAGNSGAAYVLALAPIAFSEWLAERKLIGPDALDSADPDHDGIPNFLAYTLGQAGTVAQFKTGSLEFSRSTMVPVDAVLHIQQSTDLIAWDELAQRGSTGEWAGDFAANVSEILQGSTFAVTAIPNDPAPTEPALFMRLKATRLPDN